VNDPSPASPRRRAWALSLGVVLALALSAAWLHGGFSVRAVPGVEAEALPLVSAAPEADAAVAALGRLEPKDGVIRVAGPSAMVVVVRELLVDKGDPVKRGQVIAILDEAEIREAAVARARARVENAGAELRRNRELHKGAYVSDSVRDAMALALSVARAELRSAEAELERTRVRSPIDGRVLEVHARDGERVEADGIVEVGRTQEMMAVGEVYETDVGRVRVGQRARVQSPALPRPLQGRVDRIGLKVGKMDALGTDPAARTDARVVEVEVRLDPEDGALAASLTHLQVQVEFEP
jgi:HlyD family secretion protein